MLLAAPTRSRFRLLFFFLLLNISSFSHNPPPHLHRSKFTRACYVMDHKRGGAGPAIAIYKKKKL